MEISGDLSFWDSPNPLFFERSERMSDFEARPFELTAKDTEGKVKEVTERLEAGVRELFESERYQAYLKAMS